MCLKIFLTFLSEFNHFSSILKSRRILALYNNISPFTRMVFVAYILEFCQAHINLFKKKYHVFKTGNNFTVFNIC
ncbi:Uncharacterised protein [Streptococcus pneumoniae]|nr:Uncharacterised protein [Streptococcus pneumoniae]CGF61458.1 Uncharacterised protein [Streptococcus pneumoniae]CIW01022.1 Uncharacterised protein [Streptococcus pneumoniae]CJG48287.1 Uncharacterised protein [Streptococcus pneumoniae]